MAPKVHFGRPGPNIITLPLHGVLYLRRVLRLRQPQSQPSSAQQGRVGLIASLRFTALAYDRNRLAAKVLKNVSRGYLVLSDRYPSCNIGRMDSPKLDPAKAGTALTRLLARTEHNLYRNMLRPDLLIQFTVSEVVALERNRARDKSFKESDAEIVQRLKESQGLIFQATKNETYLNDCDSETAVSDVTRMIWQIIA